MTKVIVVGAGWFGLIAAKTYLQIHPTHSLVLLEASTELGGTWSRDRVYSGLITHNSVGALEVSDTPLEDGTPTEEGYIRGADVAAYLEGFAERYGLMERTVFGARVESIDRDGGTREWVLRLRGQGEMRCEKLIMATGLTSAPFTPRDIPITDPKMVMFHSAELGKWEETILAEKVERVTIYGGSKSAFDTAYMCAAAKKKVDWIIRDSGQSVSAMFTAKALGQTSPLLGAKRLFNALSPCIYNSTTVVSKLIHGTWLGRLIVRAYWKTLTNILWEEHGLHTSENGRKLTPNLGELGPFWSGSTPTGVISQPDFWSYVHAENSLITVHRATITSISASTINLSDGAALTSQAHVWCTGWTRDDTPIARHNPALALQAGIPVPTSASPPHWTALESTAELKVKSLFPMLSSPPEYTPIKRTKTPYRLYRLLAPPSMADAGDHNLVFVGMTHTPATGMVAELQALWSVAYLDGKVNLVGKKEAMETEVAEANVWMKRRYLNLGEKCSNLTFEFMPYLDTLMDDLGLNKNRKGGMAEWFGSYSPKDYRGFIQEWLEKERIRGLGELEGE